MEIHPPPLREELNLSGEPTVPRQAACVILVRGAADTLEVLLVLRTPAARFMAGMWVFPGGAVDAGDGEDDAAHRVAAVRELREEAGIVLGDPQALVAYSRWIAPRELVTRFDTRFYVAPLPAGQEPRVDGQETVDLRWLTPQAALRSYADGELPLPFPTLKHLEALSRFSSADALLAHARTADVRPVLPRVIRDGAAARTVLPGEPGYEPGVG